MKEKIKWEHPSTIKDKKEQKWEILITLNKMVVHKHEITPKLKEQILKLMKDGVLD